MGIIIYADVNLVRLCSNFSWSDAWHVLNINLHMCSTWHAERHVDVQCHAANKTHAAIIDQARYAVHGTSTRRISCSDVGL